MTSLDAAIAWIQKGFSPVPIPNRSKRPVLKGWEQLEMTIEVAPQYFNGKPQNIGLHLGDKYGSTDVDCDCQQAIVAARELLPETGLIFGRQSKPFSHFFYRSDPPVRTAQFIDPLDHSTLVELRGLSSDGTVGLQTVVPPSIHESGEAVRFEPGFDGTPANVDAEALTSTVRRVAAAALFARHWPTKGSRHHAFLALAGVLARAGWSVEDAKVFHHAVSVDGASRFSVSVAFRFYFGKCFQTTALTSARPAPARSSLPTDGRSSSRILQTKPVNLFQTFRGQLCASISPIASIELISRYLYDSLWFVA